MNLRAGSCGRCSLLELPNWKLYFIPFCLQQPSRNCSESLVWKRKILSIRRNCGLEQFMSLPLPTKSSVINRDHIIQALAPLFRGRVLTFLLENRNGTAEDVENNIEGLCLEFERLKPYLLQMWDTRE